MGLWLSLAPDSLEFLLQHVQENLFFVIGVHLRRFILHRFVLGRFVLNCFDLGRFPFNLSNLLQLGQLVLCNLSFSPLVSLFLSLAFLNNILASFVIFRLGCWNGLD